jgi:hypothetical protein
VKENIMDSRYTPFLVDTDQEFEVRYWARMLGVSTKELRQTAKSMLVPDVRIIARRVGRGLNPGTFGE